MLKMIKHLLKCEVCGGDICTNWEGQKYCSKECRESVYNMDKDYQPSNQFFWVYVRDGMRCQVCGKTPKDEISLHADHVYPVSEGGATNEENLITLCSECNIAKSNKILPEKELFSLWDVARKNIKESAGTYEELRDKYERLNQLTHKRRS